MTKSKINNKNSHFFGSQSPIGILVMLKGSILNGPRVSYVTTVIAFGVYLSIGS